MVSRDSIHRRKIVARCVRKTVSRGSCFADLFLAGERGIWSGNSQVESSCRQLHPSDNKLRLSSEFSISHQHQPRQHLQNGNMLRRRALPNLRQLSAFSHVHVRRFGFFSRSGTNPTMDYIPMPYIEETSVRQQASCTIVSCAPSD